MILKNKTRIFTIALICSLLFLQACSKKNEVREVEVTKKTDLEMYLEAKRTLDAGVWNAAIQRYKALRSHYPFGHYTEQGYLELAYAQYKLYKMEEAVVTVDRFIKNYPAHKNLDYAYYLKGLIYFESDRGFLERANPSEVADHNQENIRNAFTAFKNFIERFPESDYAADAHKRMVFLKNRLAAYEIHVAKYYLRRGAPIAALNRCKFVLESFQDTPASANALALMVESYTMMEEPELAEQAKTQLMTDFPSHTYLQNGELDLDTELFEWSDLWPF
ncbi:outer membrane protein assembly factor BamD [Marinicella rhabdoformis]|uniref:outer membrane protein assembly factor BamD n=1 Tax=Marinicella rhabdoformis TaxID=2580566 RepID=UPI0012AEC76D|nr:outer membrane protein assembly factor BamD [Marinicella rhabdoformis]